MILYLDTSALVKYYVKEAGTQDVAQLVGKAEIVGFASITYVEMAAALSKSARMKWVSEDGAKIAWGDFLAHFPSFTRLNVNSALIERAGRLSWEHGMRAYKALHLAAALEWKEMLETGIVLVTYDRELWLAGRKAGLDVWPKSLTS